MGKNNLSLWRISQFSSLNGEKNVPSFKREKLSFSNGTINTANHGVFFPKPGKNLQLVEIGSFVPLMGKIFCKEPKRK